MASAATVVRQTTMMPNSTVRMMAGQTSWSLPIWPKLPSPKKVQSLDRVRSMRMNAIPTASAMGMARNAQDEQRGRAPGTASPGAPASIALRPGATRPVGEDSVTAGFTYRA